MLGEKFFQKNLINKYYRLLIICSIGCFLGLIYYKGVKGLYDIIIRMIISIPINAMITNIFIDYTFSSKELKQVNAFINIFYIEVGNDILKVISKADKCEERIKALSEIKDNWSADRYQKLFDEFDTFKNCIDIRILDIEVLKKLLENATPIILELLTSTSLQDREEFEEIVQEIFILKKELDKKDNDVREKIENLYRVIGRRWITYAYNLQNFRPDSHIDFPFVIRGK